MSNHASARYKARQKVTQAINQRQRARIERDRQHVGLVVTVLDQLSKRDLAIAKHESAAREALQELRREGVSLNDVADMAGGQVRLRELQRLSKPPLGQEAGR